MTKKQAAIKIKGVYHLLIHGEPVAKGRPRVRKDGHTYTPEKTQQAEEIIQWNFKETYPQRDVDDKNIFSVYCKFWVLGYKNGKPRMFNLDNGVKLIMDALTGFIWADDNQVVEIKAIKKQVKSDPATLIEVIIK